MSKVYTYMVIAVGLTFLMKFAGIPTGADSFMAWIGFAGDASQVSLGDFFLAIAGIFTVGVGAGIAISFLTRTPSETFIAAPIALGIFTVLVSSFISIINYTSGMGWIYYLVWLIFTPLTTGFGVAIVQFWRGAD